MNLLEHDRLYDIHKFIIIGTNFVEIKQCWQNKKKGCRLPQLFDKIAFEETWA